MASHFVKCLYCGQTFDANVVPFIKPTKNRYAHEHCPGQEPSKTDLPPVFTAPAKTIAGVAAEEINDYTALRDYINELFKGKVNWGLVVGKMQMLRKQQYTYSGMLKALRWWYEIKKQPVTEVKSPLGIIPFIYNDAFDYYQAIFLAEQNNKDKKINANVREFHIDIPQPHPMKKIKLFDLDREVKTDEE